MSDRGGGLSLPADPHPIPGFPSNFRPLPFEGYTTLNVKSPRAAIEDKELGWCDGWMPLAPDNIRILPDVGPTVYSASGASILWMGFGNISDTYYGYVLQSDGTLHQFNTDTGARVQVFGPGTSWPGVNAPSSIFGQTQWGSKYLLFCKDQSNGYWLWDGSNTFTAGGINPESEITAAGLNYTSPPDITFATNGTGTGVTATATVLNNSVTLVTITNPGSGFGSEDFVVGTFSGGGSDTQATAVASVDPNSGGVTSVVVENPGSGFTPYAFVSSSGGGGSGFVAYPIIQGGAVISIAIVNPGTGYTVAPIVNVYDPGYGSGAAHVNGGSGWVGQAVISVGQITGVAITNIGSGYTTPPTVVVLGDGAGFVGEAEIQSGGISGIVIKNNGAGYTKALILLQGGNNAANATFSIFPWGISGTAIETNQARVWIANGGAVADSPPKGRVIYSDPQTPTGFGNGGGGFLSNDSFLRVGYHWLRQTNGFLYLGGDSSTNYISGVATTVPAATATTPAGAPLTTFSNQNVDPQIGSPWPASIQVFSRNIVLANAQGIFVSYGGAMTKISTPLDPLFASCPNLTGTANWSSAVANIFNVQVYMLLLQVHDKINGTLINKLLMWDGKRWFTSQQGRTLTFIATQEANSVLTAWGTDGTDVFRLFQVPSTNFTKVLQSKLYGGIGYFITKTLVRLEGVVQAYATDDAIVVALDNETETASPTYGVPVESGGTWFGAGGVVGSWTGVGGAAGSWNGNGLNIFGPIPVGQQGRLLGYTLTTACSDVALLSMLGVAQDFSTNA